MENASITLFRDVATWFLAYQLGYRKPRYPVPAIPLKVVWPSDNGYLGCVYIDDLRYGLDDPQMVRAWDFFQGISRLYWWVGEKMHEEDFTCD